MESQNLNTYIKNIIRRAETIHTPVWIAAACIAAVSVLSVLPVQTGRSAAEEYLCFVIPATAIIGSTLSVVRKSIIRFSLVDGIVLTWYLYSMGRLWLDATYPAFGFAMRMTLMCLLYISMRMMLSGTGITGNVISLLLIVFALVEAGIGYSQLLSGASRHHLYPVTGSFLNPGPYSAYLALGVAMVCALKKNLNNLSALVLTLLLVPLVLTMSRAAFLALFVCLLIIYKDRIKGWRQRAILFSAVAIIAIGLYLVKAGSADGRGIINYIGVKCMMHNPLVGGGIGSFFHQYALETADISINNPDINLMRADVLDYAFNDLLRVGVEQGVVGLVFAFALMAVVLLRLWKNCRPLFFGALSLLVISLFSYPFELLPYQIIGTIMAAYSGTSTTAQTAAGKRLSRVAMSFRLTSPLALIVAASLVCFHAIKERLDAGREYDLIAGIHDKAFIKDYYELLPYLQDNKRFLFDFGKLLSEQGRYNDSNDMLRRGALISNDPMFLVLQGNNYRDMGAFDEAEGMYLRAWHTLPNRIYPLYRLMLLHHQTGNDPKALEYAKNVAAFKEKIPSPAVRDMKREAREIISGNNKY